MRRMQALMHRTSAMAPRLSVQCGDVLACCGVACEVERARVASRSLEPLYGTHEYVAGENVAALCRRRHRQTRSWRDSFKHNGPRRMPLQHSHRPTAEQHKRMQRQMQRRLTWASLRRQSRRMGTVAVAAGVVAGMAGVGAGSAVGVAIVGEVVGDECSRLADLRMHVVRNVVNVLLVGM